MQDPLYTSSYTSACHHPLSSLQAISTMSSLSVHNDEQVDQHWTEEGAVNINDGNDDDGNDVISNQFFDNENNHQFFDYDDHDQFFILCHLALEAETKVKKRKAKWEHERMSWHSHVKKLCHEDAFEKTYRMSLRAFKKLVYLLESDVIGNFSKCGTATPIYPEIVLAIGIRWLAGGSYIDIRHAYGCSIASIYRCRDLFLEAVLNCDYLKIIFPKTRSDLVKLAIAFEQKSTEGLIRGCVGAIDGFLATISRPTLRDCGNNPGAFYSGHYMTYGINVQAICDVESRFIFFGVIAPGRCSDQVAFERTALPNKTALFDSGFYLVGDAAYTLSDVMLVPFVGSQRDDQTQDAYNFFLSQLRIRIEMTFGLLQTKWAVLKRNLTTGLETTAKVLEVCARLHNYVIDENKVDKDISGLPGSDEADDIQEILAEITPVYNSPLGWGYLPTVEKLDVMPGTSVIRDVILERIANMGLQRPPGNIERKRLELHELNLM